jgi:hypothetical protein
MIVFDLSCADGHRFEGWFGSSADFEDQCARGLLNCPACGSAAVADGPTQQLANAPLPPKVQKAIAALAKAQAEALKNSTWVGDKFADETRKMHYGERDEAPIHGQASLAEAKALIDEGVPVAPLPFPVAPPEKLN